MSNAVIVDYLRTPFSPARKGRLAAVRPDDLGVRVVTGLLERTSIDHGAIEDVIFGCAFPEAEQGLNLGRMIGLLAGLPDAVGGVTVNRFCGSSMQAVHMAAGAISLGAGHAFICAGVESMSLVPMSGHNPLPNPQLYERRPGVYATMGDTAETVARQESVSRLEQEAFAVESHRRAVRARESGSFSAEIVAVGDVDTDECIRSGTSLEALAKLEPAFLAHGTVTAGTSSPLTDGAAGVLVCSDEFARTHGLRPLARIKAVAVAGCAPETMGMGPVAATRKALARSGLRSSDLGVVELNEAFASQALACMRQLELSGEHVNIDGGAIALGHPLGATGARIVGKLASLLQREGKELGLATQCIGGGQGIATVLEAV